MSGVGNKCSIAIIGLGYVGLPLARLFVENGHFVYGIDADSKKIQKLINRQSYLSDFTTKDIKLLFTNYKFHVGDSYDVVSAADVIIICVPTPLDRDSMPDLTYVKSALQSIVPYLREGHLIITESSTYPGMTQEELLPLVESGGLVVGKNVFLAYSPERIDPGRYQNLRDIPKVLGGVSETCTTLAKELYESIFERVVVVSSPKVAEFTKILENCQRLVNISFMNELAMMAEKLDVNLWEAIDAASTKPYGFTPYYPGPGIGGHCIPVDPLYLSWKAKQRGFDLKFVELAHEINESMPDYVVQRVRACLSGSKPLQASSVFVIGVTYKRDVNDLRESRAVTIVGKLLELGVQVNFHDPYINEIEVGGRKLKGVALTKRYIQRHDCVLILTDHSRIPYDSIAAYSRLVIDTRNATKHIQDRGNIVLL
ncbi:UDP-N-acetyl-D-glucosamine dehydrogenase [Gordoniibacillus kamchatkensis]|uniref:UDP-N-acetyl-D-glucosamine dehydrogenase n=1 Tax=Gordoniibacillus kamchatkensis TaxID=1590651 RepID=A0ABR5AKY6_9BACL|nr:nucleotide sugar dehydrogenase [Paenibacillus sp. VKM B-2647]KIL41616.1 UDP-N-acetyl-D-glucosamine dehydrogenase [Paenibacillus sp. VKM B-2647]